MRRLFARPVASTLSISMASSLSCARRSRSSSTSHETQTMRSCATISRGSPEELPRMKRAAPITVPGRTIAPAVLQVLSWALAEPRTMKLRALSSGLFITSPASETVQRQPLQASSWRNCTCEKPMSRKTTAYSNASSTVISFMAISSSSLAKSMTPNARKVRKGSAPCQSAVLRACVPSRQLAAYVAATPMPAAETTSSSASAQCSATSQTCCCNQQNCSSKVLGISGVLLILAIRVPTLSTEYLFCVCPARRSNADATFSQMGTLSFCSGALDEGAMKAWRICTSCSESCMPSAVVAARSSSCEIMPSLFTSKCSNAAATIVLICDAVRLRSFSCASTRLRPLRPCTNASRWMSSPICTSSYPCRNCMRRSASSGVSPREYLPDNSMAAWLISWTPRQPWPCARASNRCCSSARDGAVREVPAAAGASAACCDSASG
mmetsp:Transcript_87897/g.226581  ORF Transcript_87897/g.226581 Transcript_87897/m.226581 type:complete len:439 (+) Transcript_87897:1593-2909(+)